MKTKTGVKVVSKTRERFFSTHALIHPYDVEVNERLLGVEYKINEFVFSKEKTLPLFVFETLEDALEAFSETSIFFECEYIPSEHRVNCFGFARGIEEEIQLQQRPVFIRFEDWGQGVAFADAVKLIKRVEFSND